MLVKGEEERTRLDSAFLAARTRGRVVRGQEALSWETPSQVDEGAHTSENRPMRLLSLLAALGAALFVLRRLQRRAVTERREARFGGYPMPASRDETISGPPEEPVPAESDALVPALMGRIDVAPGADALAPDDVVCILAFCTGPHFVAEGQRLRRTDPLVKLRPEYFAPAFTSRFVVSAGPPPKRNKGVPRTGSPW